MSINAAPTITAADLCMWPVLFDTWHVLYALGRVPNPGPAPKDTAGCYAWIADRMAELRLHAPENVAALEAAGKAAVAKRAEAVMHQDKASLS